MTATCAVSSEFGALWCMRGMRTLCAPVAPRDCAVVGHIIAGPRFVFNLLPKLKPGIVKGHIAFGGGPIALMELKYAYHKKMACLYVPTKGKWGACRVCVCVYAASRLSIILLLRVRLPLSAPLDRADI